VRLVTELNLQGDPQPGAPGPAVGMARGALETIAARGLMLPLNFGVTVVTSRWLLPTGRGALVLGLLTVTLAGSILGNVGIGAAHQIARDRLDAPRIVRQTLILSLALSVLGVAVLLPLDFFLVESRFSVTALLAFNLPGMLVAQAIGSVLLALGKLRIWNALQVLVPVSVSAGTVLFVAVLDWGVTGAVVGSLLSQALELVAVLVVTRSLWSPLREGLDGHRRMWPMLRLGLKLGLINSVSLLNYRIEMLILEGYEGLAAVGIYSMASSLAELLWIVSSSIATAVVASAIVPDSEAAARAIARGVRGALAATLPLAGAAAALGWWAIPIVFGRPFEPSINPLWLLLPGVVAYSPAAIVSVFFTIRLGESRVPFVASIASCAATGVLCLPLVPHYGAAGAATASTIGYVAGISVLLVGFVRRTTVKAGDLLPRPADFLVHRRLSRLRSQLSS
jgi:O-antigen/teichoic acid export membrane protein